MTAGTDKRVILTRGVASDEGTFGALELIGGPMLRSVELPWRNNETAVSCIPPGVYTCAIVNSPTFGRVYGVQAVPGRSAILIHAANWAGDVSKGWHSQLKGCIAPAMSIGRLQPPGGRPLQRAGLRSGEALRALMDWAGGQPFSLEIR